MRFTSKLVMLAAMVLAAMAFGTTTASADIPVEAEVEGGAHCDGSNCDVHVTGESHLRNPVTGQIFSQCNDEYTTEFEEDGLGTIHSQVLSPEGGAGCNVIPCANTDWPIEHAEEIATDEVVVEVLFCLGAGSLCEPPVHIEEIAPHVYAASIAQSMTALGNGAWQCPSGAFVEGTWLLEGDGVELEH